MTALDSVANFVSVQASTGYTSSATSIVLQSGQGAKLPTPSFNIIWWNSTDYSNPANDPNVEIVRVTAVSTDTLTITRAQESTTASNKNTSGKTYSLVLGPTAKMITDISAAIDAVLPDQSGNSGKYLTTNGTDASWDSVSGGGTGTVTDVTSDDGSITVTDGTTTPDLSVVSAPKLTTARTIDGESFDGSADITVIAPGTHAATSKTTPADDDELPITDSAASYVLKKLTWSNLLSALNSIYQTALGYTPAHSGSNSDITSLSGLTTALSVGQGGTGATTLTGVLIGNGTSAITAVTSPTGTIVGTSDTQTLTNKRNQPRPSSSTSTSTLTPSKATADTYYITAQAASLTIAAPTGTPVIGEVLSIYVTDNGTSQTLAFNSVFNPFGAPLPTATTVSKTLMIVAQFDGSSWSTVTNTQQ